MATSRFFSTALSTVKRHPCILPLLGACTYSGSLGLFVLGYTSLRKADVQWNKWGNPWPYGKLDWTKPTQKILMTNSTDYDGYKPQFDQEKLMEQLIYGDGEYRR